MGKRRRGRVSGGNWWNQSSGGMKHWVAVALITVSIVSVAVAYVASLNRTDATASTAYTPRPAATFSQPAEKPRVVFIGDSYTGGSTEDSGETSRFPRILQNDLDFYGTILARGGSGYLALGPSDAPITTFVEDVPADAALVVVMGSRNDIDDTDITDAANSMYDALRARVPDARVLIVGPPWVSADVPDEIDEINDALRSAAGGHGFDFVAASETPMLAGDGLIGADKVHPTDAGHRVLADYLRPLVAERLPDRP